MGQEIEIDVTCGVPACDFSVDSVVIEVLPCWVSQGRWWKEEEVLTLRLLNGPAAAGHVQLWPGVTVTAEQGSP